MAFTPSPWHMVRRKPGHQLMRGSPTWRVWVSPLFWKMRMTKEDLSLEETVTSEATDLDPLGGIQIYNVTNGQIVFIPPSIHHRKPQYLADDFGLAFEVLEEAKDAPKERRAVQRGYCFKYGSLHVHRYVPIPERMMESIKKNLRWLTDVRRVPCYVVQTMYNVYPGADYIPGMIQPPVPPRKEHDKETTTERNERRKRSKRNRKRIRYQVSGTGNLGLPRPFIGSWRSKSFPIHRTNILYLPRPLIGSWIGGPLSVHTTLDPSEGLGISNPTYTLHRVLERLLRHLSFQIRCSLDPLEGLGISTST